MATFEGEIECSECGVPSSVVLCQHCAEDYDPIGDNVGLREQLAVVTQERDELRKLVDEVQAAFRVADLRGVLAL